MKIIEKIVLLRSMNYIRVSHDYWWQFNLIIPFVFSIVTLLLIFFLANGENYFGSGGLLSSFSQILAILAPFYIASLAAVATFGSQSSFDSKFKMVNPPTIQRLVKGSWKTCDVSLRQFLCMLFGYCSVAAIFLFFVTIFVPFFHKGIVQLNWCPRVPWEWPFLFVFLFLLYHLVVATLLGLYYLADKMHRDD